jgi:hypothetical protein
MFSVIEPAPWSGGCGLPGGSLPTPPERRFDMHRADLNPEDGRHRWRKWLRRLPACLSFLFTIYKIVREIYSHL